ncbi:hypothetical protein [Burkholderia guangdongensis]|uniref:hypothetical protein n=1 Tax=Burkholderia guangdongensis TaxID=1792500 RepID=UPI0015CC9B95|nr:hypothetical protein [Burkholderia guangdongensis]
MSETAGGQPGAGILAFRADRQAVPMIVCGSVLLVLCAVLGLLDDRSAGMGGAISGSVMCIVIGVWRRASTYVTFDSDCFETKLAPVSGWHTVLYSEVTRVDVAGKMLTVDYRPHNAPAGAKPTRIRIRLSPLREANRQRCIDAFRARLPAAAFAAAEEGRR